MQYLPSIKSVVTRGTITNSIIFHHDHGHDTKECHTLRKKDKTIDHQRLSSPVHEKKKLSMKGRKPAHLMIYLRLNNNQICSRNCIFIFLIFQIKDNNVFSCLY